MSSRVDKQLKIIEIKNKIRQLKTASYRKLVGELMIQGMSQRTAKEYIDGLIYAELCKKDGDVITLKEDDLYGERTDEIF